MTKYKDIEYIVFKQDFGHFCGYVKIPSGHPFIKLLEKKSKWGSSYDNVPLEVHGGLTFGANIQEGEKSLQNFTSGWWVGWDYAHAGDYIPFENLPENLRFHLPYDKKWTYEEVKAECKNAIDQILKAQGGEHNG